jgi:hypothetical protein
MKRYSSNETEIKTVKGVVCPHPKILAERIRQSYESNKPRCFRQLLMGSEGKYLEPIKSFHTHR